jgi:hypothetical protein
MALTLTEALADLGPALALVEKSQEIIAAVPAKDVAKPSDYVKAVASILLAAGPLADAVADQVKS